MSRSRVVVLYGMRWLRERFGMCAAMVASSRGRSSSFWLSGQSEESSVDTMRSRAMAWLGMTPGSSAR